MREIRKPITLEDPRDKARRRKEEATKEWLTGFLVGVLLMLFITICVAHKAMAAPVNSPADAERAKAEVYLSENGIAIPAEVEFWCERYGEEYQICPEILESMCWVESNCQPTAQSADKACKGLMQIKPECHKKRMDRLGVRNIFGTWENIKTGTDYLAELRGDDDDIAAALYIYNGNETGADSYRKTRELTGYAAKVLKISAALERAHGK